MNASKPVGKDEEYGSVIFVSGRSVVSSDAQLTETL